jgi:hypothetical protein
VYDRNQKATPEILLNKQYSSSLRVPIQGVHILKDVSDKAHFDVRKVSIKLLLHIHYVAALIHKHKLHHEHPTFKRQNRFHIKLSNMGIKISILNVIR